MRKEQWLTSLVPCLLVLAACSGKVSIGSNASTSGSLKKNPDGTATGNGQTCTYASKNVAVGEKFASPDGCNTCTCASEGAYCTEVACAIDAGGAGDGGDTGACNYNGNSYSVGASFPSSDGCNSCSCSANGDVYCTEIACANDCSAPNSCSGPAPGTPTILCADGTEAGPTCTGTAGQCGWTFTQCACQGTPGHKAGGTWQEACSSCSCDSAGMVACTTNACACPPDGTINCMPPVPANKTDVCIGSYHQWITNNCANVKFVY